MVLKQKMVMDILSTLQGLICEKLKKSCRDSYPMTNHPLSKNRLKYNQIGFIVLLSFSFLSFSDFSPALERISLFILLCLALTNVKNFSFKSINPIYILALFWLIYIWINTLLRLIEKDFLVVTDFSVFLDRGKDWTLVVLFPVISVFLNSSDRRAYFLSAAGIGLLFSIFSMSSDIDWDDFFELETRYGFSHPINHFALYIGTLLIGLIVFGLKSILSLIHI